MDATKPLQGKRIVVTGGTGSLGKVLTRRLLGGEMCQVAKIIIFSRDEAKQHSMRLEHQNLSIATEEVIFRDSTGLLDFRIGDVRDYASVATVLRNADFVINAAALKQVPTCEYFPFEAVKTNVEGAHNIVRAIEEHSLPIDTVVGISTDKACKPVNVMGMTKVIQERIFIQGNMRQSTTRFICVRYGNVLASRGSVIPLFQEQISTGGPVTITTPDMTRFLLSLQDAVDSIFAALRDAAPGETYIPRARSARLLDIAKALIGDRPIETRMMGIRPGEKIHEILVSEEEAFRTFPRGNHYVIQPVHPELRRADPDGACLNGEYSSADLLMTLDETARLLAANGLMAPRSSVAELLL